MKSLSGRQAGSPTRSRLALMTAAKFVVAAASLLGALVLGLYGLFAISYQGDGGSEDTYVLVAGGEVDADVFGAVALLAALLLLGVFAAIVLATLAASGAARATQLEAVLGPVGEPPQVVAVQEDDRDRSDGRERDHRPTGAEEQHEDDERDRGHDRRD